MRTLILFYLSLLLLMEVHSQTFPHVCFMDQTLANHSYVDLSEVGSDESGSDSVLCYTDLSTCCTSAQSPVHRGNWYFPDGARLLFSSDVGDIYEQRAAQRVDLRRRNNANSPTGIYRCSIPTNAVHDDTDIPVRDSPVYVGLYTASGGNANWKSHNKQDCHWLTSIYGPKIYNFSCLFSSNLSLQSFHSIYLSL